jgi:hypothetical protein
MNIMRANLLLHENSQVKQLLFGFGARPGLPLTTKESELRVARICTSRVQGPMWNGYISYENH